MDVLEKDIIAEAVRFSKGQKSRLSVKLDVRSRDAGIDDTTIEYFIQSVQYDGLHLTDYSLQFRYLDSQPEKAVADDVSEVYPFGGFDFLDSQVAICELDEDGNLESVVEYSDELIEALSTIMLYVDPTDDDPENLLGTR